MGQRSRGEDDPEILLWLQGEKHPCVLGGVLSQERSASSVGESRNSLFLGQHQPPSHQLGRRGCCLCVPLVGVDCALGSWGLGEGRYQRGRVGPSNMVTWPRALVPDKVSVSGFRAGIP